jgi:hypothetical protein
MRSGGKLGQSQNLLQQRSVTTAREELISGSVRRALARRNRTRSSWDSATFLGPRKHLQHGLKHQLLSPSRQATKCLPQPHVAVRSGACDGPSQRRHARQ